MYQVVAEQLETFLRRQQERDRPVPRFVVEEQFRSFLDCGVLARGFVRLRCQSCGHARLTSNVLNVFIRALFGELRRRASQLPNVRNSQCGAVTFVQRFGDALNANPHFHSLVIDGVYAAGENGHPEFHHLPAPEDAEVLRLTTIVTERIQSLLERRGLGKSADPEQADPLAEDDPGMARSGVKLRTSQGCDRFQYRPWRSAFGRSDDGDSMDAYQSPLCAMVCGFSVHGNVCVDARDRIRLERLIRYAARPAVCMERLAALPNGQLLYRLKRPRRDGTTAVIFERQDFMAKLAVLVPAPRAHLTRFHGVFGPAAEWRPLIVPAADDDPQTNEAGSNAVSWVQPPTIPLVGTEPAADTPRKRNYSWAELMKRVFLVDVLECERCGGRMKIIAAGAFSTDT